jgi:hypothetical protein
VDSDAHAKNGCKEARLAQVRQFWGTSSTRAEIYSKLRPKRLLGVIFHPKTAKMGIWTRLLREILAHNTDCMQVSAMTRLYFTQ